MRYRKLDDAGDYCFGRGQSDFLINSVEAVGQAVSTRLGLWTGEWFANIDDGTDWNGKILGAGTTLLYELELRARVLETVGVVAIVEFNADFDANRRMLNVEMRLDTVFGQTNLQGSYAQ